MHTNSFKIVSFYEFINLKHLEQLKLKLFMFFKNYNFKGSVLLANEGVNATLSLKAEHLEKFEKFLTETFNKKIILKVHDHESHVFLRLKIKIKSEIIRLGKKDVSPRINAGNYVQPEEWDQLIKEKDVLLVDTRNNYESKIGSFKGSLQVNSSNFTEFPKWVNQNKKKIKNKKIAMFCTGGIRCEKASSYLMKVGFDNIFQLEGGIISYLKKTKNKEKNWIGECFVFDDRVSITENLHKGNYFQCFACRSPINIDDKKSQKFREGVSCPYCYDQTSSSKKENFEERKKQIKLAKKKGIKHLGS